MKRRSPQIEQVIAERLRSLRLSSGTIRAALSAKESDLEVNG